MDEKTTPVSSSSRSIDHSDTVGSNATHTTTIPEFPLVRLWPWQASVCLPDLSGFYVRRQHSLLSAQYQHRGSVEVYRSGFSVNDCVFHCRAEPMVRLPRTFLYVSIQHPRLVGVCMLATGLLT